MSGGSKGVRARERERVGVRVGRYILPNNLLSSPLFGHISNIFLRMVTCKNQLHGRLVTPIY